MSREAHAVQQILESGILFALPLAWASPRSLRLDSLRSLAAAAGAHAAGADSAHDLVRAEAVAGTQRHTQRTV
jgi:hypothetical protein